MTKPVADTPVNVESTLRVAHDHIYRLIGAGRGHLDLSNPNDAESGDTNR